MTAGEFSQWRKRMSLTIRGAAAELGCSTRTVQSYERGTTEVPRYIALACAAVAYDLPPWRP